MIDKNPQNPFMESDVAEAYDEFYNNPVGQMFDKLEKRAILSMIPNSFKEKGNLHILEVGSGTGHWTEFFAQFTEKADGLIIGIEPSKPMLEQALKKHIKRADFVNTDVLSFKTDSKFDLIAFITSLEFMSNSKEVLRHITQFIKPSGILILGVLNAESPMMQSLKATAEIYKTAHFYTESELRELLEEFGEVSIKQSTFFLPDQPEQIERADEIEERSLSENLKTGAFLAARVSNINFSSAG